MKRPSSRRFTLAPNIRLVGWAVLVMASSSLGRRGGDRRRAPGRCVDVAPSFRRELLGGRMDGAHDVMVARAPAEIPLETGADLLLGRMRVAAEQLVRRHDHSGRAEAALKSVLFGERLLQRMQLADGSQTFDGEHLGAVG